MKKSFFSIFMSTLALILGFSSCKKEDCQECFSVTYGGQVYRYCEEDFVNKTAYDNSLTYYLSYYSSNVDEYKDCD